MKPVEMHDLLSYKFLSSLKWAPGGKRAAFAVSNAKKDETGYESRLYLYENGAVRQLTDMGKESSYTWLSGEELIFSAVRSDEDKKSAESGMPFSSWYKLNVCGGEAIHAFTLPIAVGQLEKLDNGSFVGLAGYDLANPDIAFADEKEKGEYFKKVKEDKDYEVLEDIPFYFNGGGFTSGKRRALYTISSDGKDVKRVSSDGAGVFMVTVDGNDVYFDEKVYKGLRPLKGALVKKMSEDGTIETIFNDDDFARADLFRMEGVSYITGGYALRHGLNENEWVYRLENDGTVTPVLKQEYSMYGSVGSDCRLGGGDESAVKGGKLYYVTTREGDAVLYSMDKDGKEEKVFTKSGSIDCFTACEETDEILLVAMYDMKLQELYSLDLATGKLTQVSHFNDDMLADRYVAQPEPLEIKSEGLTIGGWVLKPRDYDPEKKYPAVLDIHGGPKTVYGPVFVHEMQLWASMGYFVMFCNPMGGDGRDNEFMDIRGKYGTTDYKNIMDFADAVLDMYPAIDRTKVCETGGSYGGFMTNWIITHTDRFCCAASQRSISNWLSFYGTSDIGFYFAQDQNLADIYDTPDKLWARSPLAYAKNAVTPTLFIHSDKDYRCPLEQGMQMYTALVERGVEARMCLFHEETHELSRSGMPKHRLRRLTEITDWFEKHAR